ncbi:RNA deprotection pyrophosphohydrolase [Pseudalkalibacillus berkeleyi]|uniref:Nucleoside triphosphatase YtkD n=1 Tax=Pseudalkalibacillus berkeleyi TaxID=1069813 RepID=A0ABS9H0A5_9BACL|nr:nucleoside triphosphatase YtkD [Pseudalkalibacillus berkeleyi]MCF6138369.1 nucleoside triphosphatase YtkD [Pseudalkalibacillus berkeleyi]
MSCFTFEDYYHNEVELSFTDHPYSSSPKHVWIICRFKGQWLLTEHPRRGIEFPGGKVEEGETAEIAAVREVYEETGATVDELYYLGQYRVNGKGGTIIKNVYFATIEKISLKAHYFETNGPLLKKNLPASIKNDHKYSFMMKDQVLERSLAYMLKEGITQF